VIFDTLPAKWEIGQVPANVPAQMFWRKMIQEYTEWSIQRLIPEG